MKKIIIAPNAFKNSLNAIQTAEAIRRGLEKSRLNAELITVPIGDGGDGTAKLIHNALQGEWVVQTVNNPIGEAVESGFSLIENGKTAVIEMADASGLKCLQSKEQNPLKTSSIGTGELIKAALDQGVKKIILGIGGSATVDGGCGILQALGVRFKDLEDLDVKPVPEELIKMERVDYSDLDPRLKKVKLEILCDVENPLLGEEGAARVFGPQKGATQKDVEFLERFLEKWSILIKQDFGSDVSTIKHGGAAGGTAAGLQGVLNARLKDGITSFLKIIEFERYLRDADLVITGEGSLDEQTLAGKGPMGVALWAQKHHIPCMGMAGTIPLTPSAKLRAMFPVLIPINHKPQPLKEALKNTRLNLERTACAIGNLWSI